MYSKTILTKADGLLNGIINHITLNPSKLGVYGTTHEKHLVALLCNLHRCRKVVGICLLHGLKSYRNVLKKDLKNELNCFDDQMQLLMRNYSNDSEFGQVLLYIETKIMRFKRLMVI